MAVSVPSNQLLLIEAHSLDVSWTEPVDLKSDELLGSEKGLDSFFRSPHRRGVHYALLAGYGVLAPGADESQMRQLLGLDAPGDNLELPQQEKDTVMRVLSERLADRDFPNSRLIATLLLGQLGFETPLTHELLEKALQDDDPKVRAAARLSLAKLGE